MANEFWSKTARSVFRGLGRIAPIKKAKAPRPRSLRFDTLEARQVMAANITAVLSEGLLRIEGSEGRDQIEVARVGEQILVRGLDMARNGSVEFMFAAGEVDDIELLAGGGDDFIDISENLFDARLTIENLEIQGGAGRDVIRAPGSMADQTAFEDVFLAQEAFNAMDYHEQARWELLNRFRDEDGFVIEIDGGKLHGIGEGVLFTSVAAISFGAEASRIDAGDTAAIDANNQALTELLTTLLHKAWDEDGNPIRHPDDWDYVREDGELVRFRQAPMSKDGFGAAIMAAHYAYHSPHATEQVRELARALVQKWSEYLVLNQWRLYSTLEGEEMATADEKYIHILNENGNQKMAKGPDAFMLLPHERYALKNVAADMGINTLHWSAWGSMVPSLIQTAGDYIAEAVGRAVDGVLRGWNQVVKLEVPLEVNGWDVGTVQLPAEFRIAAVDRENIVEGVKTAVQELVRAYNYVNWQQIDVAGIVVDRMLDRMPGVLGSDSWRSVLTGTLQQVIPWLSGEGFLEVATFIGSIESLTLSRKADVAGYTAWSVLAELETRPEMVEALQPALYNFWVQTRGDIGNGVWAWMAGDPGRVSQYLGRFEAEALHRYSDYAWHRDSSGFFGKQDFDSYHSSRIDYLVLRALEAKGRPTGVADSLTNLGTRLKNALERSFAAVNAALADAGRAMQEQILAPGMNARQDSLAALETRYNEAVDAANAALAQAETAYHNAVDLAFKTRDAALKLATDTLAAAQTARDKAVAAAESTLAATLKSLDSQLAQALKNRDAAVASITKQRDAALAEWNSWHGEWKSWYTNRVNYLNSWKVSKANEAAAGMDSWRNWAEGQLARVGLRLSDIGFGLYGSVKAPTIKSVVDTAVKTGQDIGGAVQQGVNNIGQAINGTLAGASASVKNFVNDVKTRLTNALNDWKNWLNTCMNNAATAFTEAKNSYNSATSKYNAGVTSWKDWATREIASARNSYDNFKASVDRSIATAKSTAASTISKAESTLLAAKQNYTSAINSAKNAATTAVDRAKLELEAARTAGKTAIDRLGSEWVAARDAVNNRFQAFREAVVEAADQALLELYGRFQAPESQAAWGSDAALSTFVHDQFMSTMHREMGEAGDWFRI